MSPLHALTQELLADTVTPVSAYLKLCSGEEASCLLESAEITGQVGRYSVVAWDPLANLTLGRQGVTRELAGQVTRHPAAEFFPLIRQTLAELDCPEILGLPFAGSLVGYVGWETAGLIERLPLELADDPPTARLAFPSRLVIFDHLRRLLTLVALGHGEDECRAKLGEMREALGRRLPLAPAPCTLSLTPPPQDRYLAAVEAAKEYIRAGDIFQVVLGDAFRGRANLDPFGVYRRLRVKSPSPYMFHLDFGAHKLVGASPETLVKVADGEVFLRPIAGTRGRSHDPVKDRELEREMVESEKERAEHLMLVDLGRNDAGRVSEYGTVSVDPYMVVERYSHVMHLVSEVRGQLRPELDIVDAFVAAFPAGTVSGAPKVRAMEIIAELEDSPRGVYGGAVGFFGPRGRLDTCLAIRLVQFHGDEITVRVGAGIVADSIPEMEYREINHKAGQSLAALEAAAKGDF
ncbi:MAG: anthranilate synthase component I family protein [Deltaproteobacteria bacterium]|nr:anthranilate synthase component I family protein [Deltaproteobacteria bacterium]